MHSVFLDGAIDQPDLTISWVKEWLDPPDLPYEKVSCVRVCQDRPKNERRPILGLKLVVPARIRPRRLVERQSPGGSLQQVP